MECPVRARGAKQSGEGKEGLWNITRRRRMRCRSDDSVSHGKCTMDSRATESGQQLDIESNDRVGLEAPKMDSDDVVTGATKERHRIENKRRRVTKQAKQTPCDYWASHKGHFSIPTPKQGPAKHRGGMCPSGVAMHHPAADLLL